MTMTGSKVVEGGAGDRGEAGEDVRDFLEEDEDDPFFFLEAADFELFLLSPFFSIVDNEEAEELEDDGKRD